MENNSPKADFQSHTTESDGYLTPEQLLHHAKNSKIIRLFCLILS